MQTYHITLTLSLAVLLSCSPPAPICHLHPHLPPPPGVFGVRYLVALPGVLSPRALDMERGRVVGEMGRFRFRGW